MQAYFGRAKLLSTWRFREQNIRAPEENACTAGYVLFDVTVFVADQKLPCYNKMISTTFSFQPRHSPGLFPHKVGGAHPFFEGKAPGTRLRSFKQSDQNMGANRCKKIKHCRKFSNLRPGRLFNFLTRRRGRGAYSNWSTYFVYQFLASK